MYITNLNINNQISVSDSYWHYLSSVAKLIFHIITFIQMLRENTVEIWHQKKKYIHLIDYLSPCRTKNVILIWPLDPDLCDN